MNTLAHCRNLVAVAAMLVAGGAFSATLTKTEFNTAKARIGADQKAEATACLQLGGNTRDVCQKQASGKEKVALAALAYQQSGKLADSDKLAVVTADATYDVSKERCDDSAGQAKDTCLLEAKTVHTKALADAKLHRKVDTAQADAAAVKRDADHKLAAEKCEVLANESKTACLDTAKARFGKT
ncbi:MAG: hypothetical protein Q8N44_09325 [Rubrivivax sp.]|nr:hypothetical protein [Rubrivivax sp.]